MSFHLQSKLEEKLSFKNYSMLEVNFLDHPNRLRFNLTFHPIVTLERNICLCGVRPTESSIYLPAEALIRELGGKQNMSHSHLLSDLNLDFLKCTQMTKLLTNPCQNYNKPPCEASWKLLTYPRYPSIQHSALQRYSFTFNLSALSHIKNTNCSVFYRYFMWLTKTICNTLISFGCSYCYCPARRQNTTKN